MSANNKRSLEIIKLLKHREHLTVQQMASLMGISEEVTRRLVNVMVDRKDLVPVYMTKSRMSYRLWSHERDYVEVKHVQKFVPQGLFTGVDWNPERNRPGCQEFLKIPSLMGAKRVGYRVPMHGALEGARNGVL